MGLILICRRDQLAGRDFQGQYLPQIFAPINYEERLKLTEPIVGGISLLVAIGSCFAQTLYNGFY